MTRKKLTILIVLLSIFIAILGVNKIMAEKKRHDNQMNQFNFYQDDPSITNGFPKSTPGMMGPGMRQNPGFNSNVPPGRSTYQYYDSWCW
ncbi:hypothetical protein [Tepidibacillus fermentans]|uniref:Uncharacterized protein n=1 Tax=Tepidibacillus fermentans TaxID=1281767 RepID=A0A4R3KA77_9BACI|nr:hypothetical protein [Tepidibacillus fermentans]TCS79897.1 hypothetical protein EDD72_11915 [Tepidibacillus fermentans]